MAEKESEDVSNNKTPENDKELDDLLTDALNDFGKPPPAAATSVEKTDTKASDSNDNPSNVEGVWSDEFIKQAKDQFEQNMQAIFSQSIDPAAADQMTVNFHKMAEAAAKALSEENPDDDFAATIAQTLQNLSEGAESLQGGFSEDELVNMMRSLGVDGDGDIAPFMQNMMQTLLSKEILYPALKDMLDKFPVWLSENQQKLEVSEYETYTKQMSFITQLCAELEKDTEASSNEEKKQRLNTILSLMQQMQDCGPLPKDLVGDIGSVVNLEEALPPPTALKEGDLNQCSIM